MGEDSARAHPADLTRASVGLEPHRPTDGGLSKQSSAGGIRNPIMMNLDKANLESFGRRTLERKSRELTASSSEKQRNQIGEDH
jgi:hypothetical protein